MAFSSGVEKRVVISKETTWGTLPATNTGTIFGRTEATFNLERAQFQSAMITDTAQTSDSRSGSDSISGTLNAELSAGTYKDIFAQLLRGPWATGATYTASTISAASGKFVRSTGSWITDGYKVGDRVTVTGFTAPATANNANWLVIGVTATDLSVAEVNGTNVTVKAAGDSVTIAVAGKKLVTPLASGSRTNDSFTVEEFYTATNEAYLTTGVKFGSAAVQVQPNQMTTVNFSAMGRTQDKKATAGAYFTAPTAASTSGMFSGNRGIVVIDGVVQGVITAANFEINGNMEAGEVILQRQAANIFLGRVTATGEISVYYQNSTFYDKFKAETDVTLIMFFDAGNGQEMVFTFPRCRLGGVNNDDKEVGGIISTMPFTALLPDGTNAVLNTSTVVIQDTLA